MSLCVDCLVRDRPDWTKRYRRGSLALLAYGAGVFLLPDAAVSYILQGLFFLVLFPWILWPLVAASRAENAQKENSRAEH